MDQQHELYNGPPSTDEVETARWMEAFYNLIVQEMNTEERFVNFFKQYQPMSVEQFISSYAHSKTYWYLAPERQRSMKNKIRSEWVTGASFCIEAIREKKLFDMQCLWRANKLQLPGIRLSCEFEFLSSECTVPVTPQDITLFSNYMDQKPLHLSFQAGIVSQDYTAIKAAFNEQSPGPDNSYTHSWYDFHNRYTGNDMLLLLPDVRGKKEQLYLQLAADEENKNNPQTATPVQPKSDLPDLNPLDTKNIEYFAMNFDSKQSYKRYKEKSDFYKPFNRKKNVIVKEDIELLERAKGRIPIEEDNDWRAAVKRAAEFYRRKMTLQALETIMEDMADDATDQAFSTEGYTASPFTEKEVKRIQRGRQLNNEPPDLDL